ncbi:ABATE domain-containing protein [Bradyrhizobium sp. 170]|uniref:CGNR zinc finger domain-containing protein n=1 Tax=Bradyrhizobium sp. 170 TaxID=2782641 RepID=UPI001FFF9DBE|nr:ABATE domain-containing protein [Bradyrhizobium sp. 170]UPK02720.1 ABATE domain-containing protein [Bradyrhizobium sp. 170]
MRQAERANPFEWSGGHPALDLVNTVDERPSPTPIENLATHHDLIRFAALAGLLDRRTAARLQRLDNRSGSRIVKRARKLREHLHDVLAAANSGRPARQPDLDALSAAIQAAHAAQTLVSSPSPGLANRRWSPALAREIPLHACSLAIECLLVDEDRKRIRKCGASDCDVYYLDTSKGRRRQWCSMKGCGNREKQRRWRSATR